MLECRLLSCDWELDLDKGAQGYLSAGGLKSNALILPHPLGLLFVMKFDFLACYQLLTLCLELGSSDSISLHQILMVSVSYRGWVDLP